MYRAILRAAKLLMLNDSCDETGTAEERAMSLFLSNSTVGLGVFVLCGDDVRVSEAMPGTQEPFTLSGFLIVEKLQPEQAAATIDVLE